MSFNASNRCATWTTRTTASLSWTMARQTIRLPSSGTRFADLRLIENGSNLGYTEGNNVGIRYALSNNADYIFILNDDTTVEPDVLTQLVRVGEANPQIGMLGPSVVSYVSRSRST